MFRGVRTPPACVRGFHAMTATDLSPEEAYRRDRLAQELLSTWSRQQIVQWLEQLNNPNYREDMRARLNQQRKEMHR